LAIGLILLSASTYTLDETEQAVIVQFGAPVGSPISEPGLHFKKPFIQEVRRFDRRLIAWDGDPNQIPTRGREFISVDTAARWRIADPLLFLKSVRDEAGARSRLNDIIDSVVRDRVSSTELVEIVRSKDWVVDPRDIERAAAPDTEQQQVLQQEVSIGREELTQAILQESRRLVPGYGIELKDVRIKRINYIPSVQQQVYNRMISERQRVAEQFRAEGEGQSSQILGETQREVAQVMSEAKRQAEVIRGRAEADATRIYNEVYSTDPEFYAFYRSLESYEKSLGKEATLILQTSADYLRYLRDTSRNPDLASNHVTPPTRPAATTQPAATQSPSAADPPSEQPDATGSLPE
jgi:membrane protease subunit HflC